ncbi:MAG: alpha/beta fold hydrolase, partial [Elusimicrobia bacterium]|nr:alpha/beta fold hydrolase [Elusimicrobiota bacterium]
MATTKKRKSSGAEASPAGAGPGFADSVVRFYSGLFQEWRRATSFKSPDLDSFFLNKDRVEVGLTPHDVVYEEGKLRLLHYRAQSKKVLRPPLLVVYALVNRPYILDLRPGRSVIEALVKGGVDVYLIDWGAPDLADRYLDLDDYVSGLIPRCAERAMKRAGTDKVSMLGYCMGGTLSTMFAATHPGWVKNLILMAAPIDFHVREGLLNLWSDARNYDVDQLVDAYGNVP